MERANKSQRRWSTWLKHPLKPLLHWKFTSVWSDKRLLSWSELYMKQGQMQYVQHFSSYSFLLPWHDHTTLENWCHLLFTISFADYNFRHIWMDTELLALVSMCVSACLCVQVSHYVSNEALSNKQLQPTSFHRHDWGLRPTLSAMFHLHTVSRVSVSHIDFSLCVNDKCYPHLYEPLHLTPQTFCPFFNGSLSEQV